MNSRSLGQLCAGQLTLLDSRPWPRGWAMCVIGHEAGAVDVCANPSTDPGKELKTYSLCLVCCLWLLNLRRNHNRLCIINDNIEKPGETWGRKLAVYSGADRGYILNFPLLPSLGFCVCTHSAGFLSPSHLYSSSLWIASFSLGSLAVCLSCTSSYLLPWYLCLRLCPESSGLKRSHLCPAPPPSRGMSPCHRMLWSCSPLSLFPDPLLGPHL